MSPDYTTLLSFLEDIEFKTWRKTQNQKIQKHEKLNERKTKT